MSVRASEWIVLFYFSYLATAAVVLPLIGHRRRRIVGVALIVDASVLIVAQFGRAAMVLRDWLPLAYILLGYWLPALFVTTTDEVFEETLLRWDGRWLGAEGITTFTKRAPRPLIVLLELMYLFCYPMVPAGLGCLYLAGLSREADRFWIAVLLSAFSCYGVLPWLPTRPPRVTKRAATQSNSLIRRLNMHLVDRVSIQLNTFPSGHAAASLATALAVGARLPSVGLVLGVMAIGISIGSVVGRYHYAADVLAGLTLAVVGFVVSRFL